MALLSPGIIGGLSAGFQGDQMLTELLGKKLQVQAGQRALVKDTEATKANDIWSKAIMDVLTASQQGAGEGVAPPIAPQPGQASVPMTQGSAGVPAQAGPGGAPPAAPGASPGGPGGAPAPNPALAVLGGAGPAPAPAPAAPQPVLPSNPLDASTILANIQAQNPGIEPGVLSAIVNDHLMPLLSTQQQGQYKQFQQQLELSKMNAEQQDRMNTLYFKYDELQQRSQDKSLDRDARLQIAAAMDATRGELADLRKQQMAMQQPLLDAQIAEAKARTADLQASAKKKQDAVATGGAAVQKLKAQSTELKTMVADAYHQIVKDAGVVGVVGVGKRIWQAGAGWVDPHASTTGSQFKQTILGIQDRLQKMVSGGYMTAAKAARLNDEVQGLDLLDNPETAKASLQRLYKDLDEVSKDPSGVMGGTATDTQVDPNTGGSVSSGGGSAAPSTTDTPAGTVKAFTNADGTVSNWKKVKSGSDLDQGNWQKQ